VGGLRVPFCFFEFYFGGQGCPGQEISHFSVYQVLPTSCADGSKKNEKEKKKEKENMCILYNGQNFVV
jgi:hypothetical protein